MPFSFDVSPNSENTTETSAISNFRLIENLVPISFHNYRTKALVDTGAGISIVSQACLSKLSNQTLEKAEPLFSFVKGVGANITPIIDCVMIPIQIGPFKVSYRFHVLQDKYDMILGMDFLKDNHANVLLQTGMFEVNGHLIPLVGPSSKTFLASVSKAQVLKQNEATSISVNIRKHPSEGVYTFEPAHLFADQYPSVEILPSVFDMATGNFQCMLVNTSGWEIDLQKGLTLGLATKVPISTITSDVHMAQGLEIMTECVQKAKALHQKPVTFPLPNPELSDIQKQQFHDLISNNRPAFAVDLSELGCTDKHEHYIDTGSERPTSARHYRQSQLVRDEMNRQIEELLRLGFIEPSTSLWRSPVCMVKKKDNSWRFAIDYRAINDKTVKISWPLPRLEDVWDRIGQSKAKYFSTLDCGSAFWQIPLDPTTKHKTSFVTSEAQYQFKRLPFGLSAAPICFQQAMSQILQGLKFVIV